jgi:hypothetical protein
MANKIVLKKSSVAAKVPLSTDLEVGEIAVNLVDQKLYSKKADGTVVLVGTGISGGTGDVTGAASSTDNAVTRFDGTTGKIIQNSAVIIDDSNNVSGVATLNAATLIIADNVTLGSSNTDTVAVNGRITTDLDPDANNAKDIGTSGRNWRDGFFGRTLHTVNLDLTGTTSFDGAQGTSGQVLTSAGTGNTPTWTTPAAGTVTSVGGTGTVNGITLTGTVTTSGSLTLGGTLSGVNLTTQVTGTLPVANGGTGAATLTANNVLLGNGTSALQVVAPGTTGNVLTSDGTTWTSAAAPASLLGDTDSATPFETSLGFEAGNVNTGTNNTFIGYQSGKANTTGTNNTAVGFKSLDVSTTGATNTAFGANSLGTNTTGSANTAVGAFSMFSNIGGVYNTAIGDSSLQNNTSGINNVAIGFAALQLNTTSGYNVANGHSALAANTTGANNTATGYEALFSNTTAAGNTAHGYRALRSNTTGVNNTALGNEAGNSGTNNLTTGSNNILIGYQATASAATVSNETTIGNSSTTSARIFGDLKFLGSYTEVVFAVTGTTPALSPTNGTIQTWTLSGNSTPTAGTWAAGQSITLMIDDGSAFTVTWSSLAVTWKTDAGVAPTLNTTGFTAITLWKVGTTIYGARVGNA